MTHTAALDDSDLQTRTEAAAALSSLGGAGLDRVLADLRSSDAETRYVAASGLWAAKEARAVQGLMSILDDQDNDVRFAVLNSLTNLSKEQPRILAEFLEDKSQNPDRRATAAIALCRVIREDIQPLVDALQDESVVVRRAVAAHMPRIKRLEATEALIEALSDSEPSVRIAAASSLHDICDKRASDALTTLLEDDDPAVREAAVRALVQSGDTGAVQPLLKMLQDHDRDIRFHAAAALRNIGVDSGSLTILLPLLNDEYHYVRSVIIEILGKLKDEYAVEPLIASLNDENQDVQKQAIHSLEVIGTSQALEAVKNWKAKQENSFQ